MKSELKKNYSIHEIVAALIQIDKHNERKYQWMVEHPPEHLYRGLLKPFRFLQSLVHEIGYMEQSFKINGVDVDFYYFADGNVDTITVKGTTRDEDAYKEGTILGNIARKISRDLHVPFCHSYSFVDSYHGRYRRNGNYVFVRLANPHNLLERTESVKEADRTLDKVIK